MSSSTIRLGGQTSSLGLEFGSSAGIEAGEDRTIEMTCSIASQAAVVETQHWTTLSIQRV